MTETTADMTASSGAPDASGRVAIAVVDRDLRYLGVSEAFARMTGVPASDHVGRRVDELGDGIVVRSLPAIRSVLAGAEPIDEATDDDPGRRRFRRSVLPVPGPGGDVAGAILVISEVTPESDAHLDAADARAEVRRERERLLAVLRSMPSGVAVADAATSTMVLANEPFERIAGASFPAGTAVAAADGLRGFRADGSAYAADDWPLVRSMTSGEVVTNEQIRLERPDGTSAVVEASSAPTRDRSGAITGGVVVMHDVTNRRRADADREQLLRRITEERILLLEVLARMQAGVLVTLPDEVVLTNDAFGAAWRYPVEQVMRVRDLDGLVALGADGRPIQAAGWPNVQAQTTDTVVGPKDLRVIRGDGTEGVIEAAAAPIRDAMGAVIGSVTVVQDVTAQRLAAKQERQLLELAASLAGAHTAAEVEDVSLEWLVGSTGAIRAGLALAEDEHRGGRSVRMLRRRSPGEPVDEVVRLPADRRRSPAEEVTQTGRALTFATTGALLERFPEVADALRGLEGEARAFVPLRAGGDTLGTVTLAFTDAGDIDGSQLTFLQNAADRIGSALQRAVASDAVRRAERRSRLLQNLATALSQAASTEEAAEQTLKAAVDWTSADLGLIAVPDEAGRMLHVVATIGFSASDLGHAQRMDVDGKWGIAEVFRTGRTIHIADEQIWRTRYAQGYEVFGALGRSQYTQPLLVQGRAVGVMALLFTEERMLTAEDRDLAEAFAAQAALALDRTRRYDAEHRAVVTFQRAMLPSHLDPAPGVTLTARYVPSSSHLEVGGDWYDVTTLQNGRLALAVGDVVGKGVESAAVMGQLRTAWRSLVSEATGPADILDRLERFAETVPAAWCSTVLCAELDPWARRVRIASAGHPPPLVAEAGSTRFLEGGRSVPLLADPGARRTEAEHELAPGATLVLYTDGLIERRTRPLSDGLEALRDAVAAGPADDVERLGDVVLGTMLDDGGSPDDAALLCVSLQTPLVLTFDADPAELRPLRSSLTRWLRVGGVPDKVADDVVLAVHEAAANAVEHAYADAPDEGVWISVSRGSDGAVVSEVRDRGRWSDRASEPTRGRGLPLMSALMDDVAIDHTPDGTTVTLRVLPEEEER